VSDDQILVWVNGRVIDEREPAILATDHGLTVGDGVFESVKIVDGRPFALERHLARLEISAAAISLPLPDRAWLRQGIADAIAAAGPRAGRLRITVTSGPGPLGSGRGTHGPTTLVHVGPTTTWAPTARVATMPWPRNERSPLAGVKIISYAENALALATARAQGADEAVLPNTAGHLCEGSGSNVFVVLDGVLYTPPLTAGCLPGVTRDLVCEAVDVVVADLPFDVVHRCEELFLTSTTRGVHPVSHVDARALPSCPGPVTRAAAAGLARLAAALDD
jgi:branched-chain amino acid aminotransferase